MGFCLFSNLIESSYGYQIQTTENYPMTSYGILFILSNLLLQI